MLLGNPALGHGLAHPAARKQHNAGSTASRARTTRNVASRALPTSHRPLVTSFGKDNKQATSAAGGLEAFAATAKCVATAVLGAFILVTADCGSASASGDLAVGTQVFSGNCAACHAGGNNVIMAEKTLRKEALEQYLDGGFNEEAIISQVENGKGAMPAWADRLTEEEIQSVAAYVYDTASKNGWSG